jgi:oxygen-dependent protoporphyrinogen oxidase
MAQRVTVIGAGFSGLTTAYYLLREGLEVRLVERQSRTGGLVGTHRTPEGLVETAANGILNSGPLEAMCREIGVTLEPPRRESRARYIWRGQPRRYPLTVKETLRVGGGLIGNAGRWRPRPEETIAAWGGRILGEGATDYGLVTALGGIYAGDGHRLSASLILGPRARALSGEKVTRPSIRGTVAPRGGMQELIDGLTRWVEQAGAKIEYHQRAEVDPALPTVVCTSAREAADCLNPAAPNVAESLRRIEMLSLVTVTAFFARQSRDLPGFGCLFPRDQGFRARGVLFNDSIFEGRSDVRSETWIFGGALDPAIVELDDAALGAVVASDRERMTGRRDAPLACYTTRWPAALPHYDVVLERILGGLPSLPPRVRLAGNYLGGIGLARILDRSARVAAEMAALLRGESV